MVNFWGAQVEIVTSLISCTSIRPCSKPLVYFGRGELSNFGDCNKIRLKGSYAMTVTKPLSTIVRLADVSASTSGGQKCVLPALKWRSSPKRPSEEERCWSFKKKES